MKLWHLKPVDDSLDPWAAWHDCMFGFVVRADSETLARTIAATKAGDEGPKAWLLAKNSTCEELRPDGQAGVVMEAWNRPK